MSAVSAEFVPPERVDEYRIARLLGRGAMGRVYLGHDTLLDRPVAIKFIAAEPSRSVRERFLIEARAVARLLHPNVVAIYRVGEVQGRPYLVSEFVAGRSLADLPKPVSAEQVVRIGRGLARGLATAHKSGVLHRDIKPANVILAESGEAKLLDFGLAKLTESAGPPSGSPLVEVLPETSAGKVTGLEATLSPAEIPSSEARLGRVPAVIERSIGATLSAVDDPSVVPGSEHTPSAELDAEPHGLPSLTRTGALVGTPRYMAPEAWRGEPATQRSDVYSLGALLYELCSGLAPHRQESIAALGTAVQNVDAEPLLTVAPEVAPALAQVVDRCLRRDPRERFADGSELLAALDGLSLAPPPVRPPEPVVEKPVAPRSRGRIGPGLGLAGVLGLGVLAFALTRKPDGSGPADRTRAAVVTGTPAALPAPPTLPDLAGAATTETSADGGPGAAARTPEASPPPTSAPAATGEGPKPGRGPGRKRRPTAEAQSPGPGAAGPLQKPGANGQAATGTEPAKPPLDRPADKPPDKPAIKAPEEPSNHDIPIER
jgi:serine/threonine protein kinase